MSKQWSQLESPYPARGPARKPSQCDTRIEIPQHSTPIELVHNRPWYNRPWSEQQTIHLCVTFLICIGTLTLVARHSTVTSSFWMHVSAERASWRIFLSEVVLNSAAATFLGFSVWFLYKSIKRSRLLGDVWKVGQVVCARATTRTMATHQAEEGKSFNAESGGGPQ